MQKTYDLCEFCAYIFYFSLKILLYLLLLLILLVVEVINDTCRFNPGGSAPSSRRIEGCVGPESVKNTLGKIKISFLSGIEPRILG